MVWQALNKIGNLPYSRSAAGKSGRFGTGHGEPMRRFLLPIACIAGLVAFFTLLPVFDPPLPHGISITKSQALTIANKAARELGIDIDASYAIAVWSTEPSIEKELAKDLELRRLAASDPVVGPRIGYWQVIYHRPGQAKFPAFGWAAVDRNGKVIGARRTPRNEEVAPAASPEVLRQRADEFTRSRVLVGAPNPVFESDRPNVLSWPWAMRRPCPWSQPRCRWG